MAIGFLDCSGTCPKCGEPIYRVVVGDGVSESHTCGDLARAMERVQALGEGTTIELSGFYDPD